MIGITDQPRSIGDCLMWSSLPENYFKSFGDKLVDIDSKWIYDFNPFVLRNKPNDITEKWECNKMLAKYGIDNPNIVHAFSWHR